MKRKSLLSLMGAVLCVVMLATTMLPDLFGFAAVSVDVLNPWGEIQPLQNQPLANRPETLDGANIGMIYYDKLGGTEFTDAAKAQLQNTYDDISFEDTVLDAIKAIEQPKAWYDEKSESYDAVMISVADDSASAYWATYHAAEFEKRGVPVVVAVSSTFTPTLAMAAEAHGITALRSVELPITAYSLAYNDMAEKIIPIAASLNSAICDSLTGPVTAAESAPAPITPKDALQSFTVPERDYAKQLQYFNGLAMDEGFGDGLPLSMPTRAAVDEMLAATTRQPDEILGKIRMGYGICTIEKIAINAVMAGAEPEFFPVIIAAMEALVDGIEDASLFHAALTANEDYTLMMIVSGPIAKELDFATDRGYMTPARRNSQTIGRAVMLAFQNIGHNTKPFVDTNRSGRTQDHTGFVFTENVDQFPPNWISHGESMGFDKNQSSITLAAIGRMGHDDGWINNEPFNYLIPELLITPGQYMLRGKETSLGNTQGVRRLANLPTKPEPGKDLMLYTLSPAHAALLLEEPEIYSTEPGAMSFSTSAGDYGKPILASTAIGIGASGSTAAHNFLQKSKLGHLTGGTKEGIREWYTKNGVKNNTTGANATLTAEVTMANVENPDIPFAAHKNIIQLLLVGENPTYSLIYQSKYMGMDAYRTQLITGATLTEAGQDTTAPSQPLNVTASQSAKGQITLTWDAPERLEDFVCYEASCDGGVNWFSAGDAQTYTFTGLKDGVSNIYLVRAISDNGNARVYDNDTFELLTRGSGRGAQAGVMFTSASALRINGAALFTIRKNATQQLTTTIVPADATPGIVWSSSNPDWVTVDAYGLITAKTAGKTAVITATTEGGAIYSIISVRVTA